MRVTGDTGVTTFIHRRIEQFIDIRLPLFSLDRNDFDPFKDFDRAHNRPAADIAIVGKRPQGRKAILILGVGVIAQPRIDRDPAVTGLRADQIQSGFVYP